jgi:hypothetical protein
MARFVVVFGLVVLASGCSLVSAILPASPTATPAAGFVPRYASPEEIAPIATAAAESCGKQYFGTLCSDGRGGYRYVERAP